MFAQQPPLKRPITQKEKDHAITVQYTNWRGENALRSIIPLNFYFGATKYHPEEQWLLEVWDCDRNDYRVYALKEIRKWDL